MEKLNKDQKRVVKLLYKLAFGYKDIESSLAEGEAKYTITDLHYTALTIKRTKRLLGIR